MGMTFIQYLNRVALGGLATLLALTPLLPRITNNIWTVNKRLPAEIAVPPLKSRLEALDALGDNSVYLLAPQC